MEREVIFQIRNSDNPGRGFLNMRPSELEEITFWLDEVRK